MPIRTIGKKMMVIDPNTVINDIRSHGYSLWKMASLLCPQHELKHNSYCQFKYWMRNGRMPKEKYYEMWRILNGTV